MHQKNFDLHRGISLVAFIANDFAFDAVMMNFIVIGESAKKIPQSVRDKSPEILWREMAGLRDLTAHNYKGINRTKIWNTIQLILPEQQPRRQALLDQLDTTEFDATES
ncbi:MAG: DUF86 domain-containing protein [Rhizobacter sp.]|nr:DUF86 domain-containing protein [Chlorobiales bacterium]